MSTNANVKDEATAGHRPSYPDAQSTPSSPRQGNIDPTRNSYGPNSNEGVRRLSQSEQTFSPSRSGPGYPRDREKQQYSQGPHPMYHQGPPHYSGQSPERYPSGTNSRYGPSYYGAPKNDDGRYPGGRNASERYPDYKSPSEGYYSQEQAQYYRRTREPTDYINYHPQHGTRKYGIPQSGGSSGWPTPPTSYMPTPIVEKGSVSTSQEISMPVDVRYPESKKSGPIASQDRVKEGNKPNIPHLITPDEENESRDAQGAKYSPSVNAHQSEATHNKDKSGSPRFQKKDEEETASNKSGESYNKDRYVSSNRYPPANNRQKSATGAPMGPAYNGTDRDEHPPHDYYDYQARQPNDIRDNRDYYHGYPQNKPQPQDGPSGSGMNPHTSSSAGPYRRYSACSSGSASSDGPHYSYPAGRPHPGGGSGSSGGSGPMRGPMSYPSSSGMRGGPYSPYSRHEHYSRSGVDERGVPYGPGPSQHYMGQPQGPHGMSHGHGHPHYQCGYPGGPRAPFHSSHDDVRNGSLSPKFNMAHGYFDRPGVMGDEGDTGRGLQYNPGGYHRGKPSGVNSGSNESVSGEGSNDTGSDERKYVCSNCSTQDTPLWRRDFEGKMICNACGLYFKLHNERRPTYMRRPIIRRRCRTSKKSAGATASEGSASVPSTPSVPKKEVEEDDDEAEAEPDVEGATIVKEEATTEEPNTEIVKMEEDDEATLSKEESKDEKETTSSDIDVKVKVKGEETTD